MLFSFIEYFRHSFFFYVVESEDEINTISKNCKFLTVLEEKPNLFNRWNVEALG